MIPLPTMNRICKSWNLPTEFQEACEYYFLRNYSDQDFVSLVSMDESGTAVIREYGINFEIIFQGEAAKVYTRNGERNEPNNTHYWCSFRSLTFEFSGRKETKSFVLVQVDKKAGIGEKRDSLEVDLKGTASGEAGAIKHPVSHVKETPQIGLVGATPGLSSHVAYLAGTFFNIQSNRSFIKASGPVSSADALAEYERIQDMKGDSEKGELE